MFRQMWLIVVAEGEWTIIFFIVTVAAVGIKWKCCFILAEPDNETERLELQAPPLPPRRLSTAQSVSDIQPASSVSTLYQTNSESSHSLSKDSRLGSSSSLLSNTGRDAPDHPMRSDSLVRGDRENLHRGDHLYRTEPTHRVSDSMHSHSSHRLNTSLHRGSVDNMRDHQHAVLREHSHRSMDSCTSLKELPPELPPKLPSRASVHNIPYSPSPETDIPPRLPPRPSKTKCIERCVCFVNLFSL